MPTRLRRLAASASAFFLIPFLTGCLEGDRTERTPATAGHDTPLSNATTYLLQSYAGDFAIEFRLPAGEACAFRFRWTQEESPSSGVGYAVLLDGRLRAGEFWVQASRVHAGGLDTAESTDSQGTSSTELPLALDPSSEPTTLVFAAGGLQPSKSSEEPSVAVEASCAATRPTVSGLGREVFGVLRDHFEDGAGANNESPPASGVAVTGASKMAVEVKATRAGFWLQAGYVYGNGRLEVMGPGTTTTYTIAQGPPLVRDFHAELAPGAYTLTLTEAGYGGHFLGLIVGLHEPDAEPELSGTALEP